MPTKMRGTRRRERASDSMATPKGEEIRQARDARSISVRELAKKAKVSYQAILRWEMGKAKPHPRTVRKVVAALNEFPIIPGIMKGEEPAEPKE